MKIPFVGQAYQSRSVRVSNQRCVNWYPEVEPGDARSVIVLYSACGIKLFTDIDASAIDFIRGAHYSQKLELFFVVSGSELYSFDAGGNKTLLSGSTAVTGSTRVIMADNGFQVGIATGTSYMLYDSTANTFATITDTGGGAIAARDIGFLNTRFIIMVSGQEFMISYPNAGQTVDPLDSSTVESNPDDLAGMLIANNRVYFFSTNSYDVFYDNQTLAAAGEFPYVRIEGAATNGFGLAGLYAKVVQDSICYWCSNDGRIYRMNGYSAERISDYGIENSLRKYPRLSDCEAIQWAENGHRFVAFIFPSGAATWVLDTTNGMWTERATGLDLGVWSANFAVDCWDGRVLFGHRSEDKIGELDLDIFTEYGEPMKAKRTTPVIHSNQNMIFTSRLELVMEVGKANSGDEGFASLRWSDDSGFNWGNWVQRSLGKIGEYATRLVWYDLGQAVNRVYDLEITDNVPRTLIECVVEGEAGEV